MNPFTGEGVLLGPPHGRAIAHKDDNGLVQIKYGSMVDLSKEVMYMKMFDGERGIPQLIYVDYEKLLIVTRELRPLESGDREHILDMAMKIFTLLRMLCSRNVYNGHLEYFTFTDGDDIYLHFRLRKCATFSLLENVSSTTDCGDS